MFSEAAFEKFSTKYVFLKIIEENIAFIVFGVNMWDGIKL